MERPHHILVIRLSAMGDVAMMVPVLKAFTEKYPDVKLTLLTPRFFAPMFKDLSNVQIFEAEVKGRHKGIFGLKKLSSELLDLKIDAVADLHNVLRSNILKLFFKLKGIPVRQLDKGRKEKKALTRSNNKIFEQLKATHERYTEVFDKLGYPIDINSVQVLEKQELTENLSAITGEKDKNWIGIAPFAQHASKAYPEDLMKEVLLKLQKGQNLRIFLFGGGKEETGKLAAWEKEFSNAVSVAGKLSFEEELSLISNLDLMLAMDSGNGHLAANFGVPVITIWGLTHPYTGFAPFRQPETNSLLPDLQKYPAIPTSIYGKNIPQGYEEVMRSIPPQKVVEKINEILN
ncbi:glycosyltransferase family 9 protein [Salinimicrobium sp. MT39]|uniref:Glycosyltransferase family 9 protein n=1 Tax=Salinimicrobium profundisediminis TaxID=2994553 RepID=A0A9X3I0Y8_9FLAO|nr:glycosyltransferase family 9 protein [Salinimicrobium profundisediminis]MCX2838520.1 glycosyltransferase family 9 protein [Salinimicrobium profundisediminis]